MKKNILVILTFVVSVAYSSNFKINKAKVKQVVNKFYNPEPICILASLPTYTDYNGSDYLHIEESIIGYYSAYHGSIGYHDNFEDSEIKIKYIENGTTMHNNAIDQMNILSEQGFYKEEEPKKNKFYPYILVYMVKLCFCIFTILKLYIKIKCL